MSHGLRTLIIVIAVIAGLVTLAWLGLRIPSPAFKEIASRPVDVTPPDSSDLPAAVQRYYEVLGDQAIPPLESGVVQGTAKLIVNGIPLNTRFQFYHDMVNAGYYHHIQATWYGLGFMNIHERLRDGHGILDLGPLGRVEDEPKVDHAAIQGFWAETMAWYPGMILTDARLAWEEIDALTARAYLPGVDKEEALTVHFDSETGLLTEIQAMRFYNADDSERTLWTNTILEWGEIDGYRIPLVSQIQWADDVPWAVWTIEHIAYNVDVSERMATVGPLE